MKNSFIILCAVFLLLSCRDTSLNTSHSKEIWDEFNRPELFGLSSMRFEELSQKSFLRGSIPDKPWQDHYWPYSEKNIAMRYIDSTEFSKFEDQKNDAIANPKSPMLSPAEKYDLLLNDPDWTLTKESWDRFDYWSNVFKDKSKSEWSWMGICSGWAPAAITEKTTVNNVLTTNSAGIEVIFFEGDIRGLLSKAHDFNKSTLSPQFIGTRCNEKEKDVKLDDSGRPVDGFFATTGNPFYIVNDYSKSRGVLQISDNNTKYPYYWIASDAPFDLSENYPVDVYIYHDRNYLGNDLTSHTIGGHADSQTTQSVTFIKNCRDLNPGSFHIILAGSLSDGVIEKHSFVAELKRTDQVWNFPVWGFSTQMGEPISVALEDSSTRPFRSPSASYFAEVNTTLVFVAEPAGPSMNYPDEHKPQMIDWDHLSYLNYSFKELAYTLEFDDNGFVVGGEWKENKDSLVDTPDFLWRPKGQITDLDSSGKPSPIKYSIIAKLLKCSQQSPDTKRSITIDNVQQDIDVVTCPIL